jgi:hypothetical protein
LGWNHGLSWSPKSYYLWAHFLACYVVLPPPFPPVFHFPTGNETLKTQNPKKVDVEIEQHFSWAPPSFLLGRSTPSRRKRRWCGVHPAQGFHAPASSDSEKVERSCKLVQLHRPNNRASEAAQTEYGSFYVSKGQGNSRKSHYLTWRVSFVLCNFLFVPWYIILVKR